MCGIAGVVATSDSAVDHLDAGRVTPHLACMAHRGPDAASSRRIPNGVLLHSRLAVRGLSRRWDQPIRSVSGRFIVAYNGEIFGPAEFCRRFNLTPLVTGESDTRLILDALDAGAPVQAIVSEINGMMALAAYDMASSSLYLARDVWGKKPLLYYERPDCLIFGSEMTALFSLIGAMGLESPSLDSAAAGFFVAYGFAPSPETVFHGVREIMPGQVLRFATDGGVRQVSDERSAQPWEEFLGKNAHVRQRPSGGSLRSVIDAAVARRLEADVGIGVLLSRGVDSAVIGESVGRQVPGADAITIGLDAHGTDESVEAAVIAKELNLRHRIVNVSTDDGIRLVDRALSSITTPIGDSSYLPAQLAFEAAKQAGYSVALTGDGGDELFGGYNRHRWLTRLDSIPVALRRLAAPSLKGLADAPRLDVLAARLRRRFPGIAVPVRPVDKARKLAFALQAESIASGYQQMLHVGVTWDGFAPGSSSLIEASANDWFRLATAYRDDSSTRTVQCWDLRIYLVHDILAKVDLASMSVSVEARSPFLDRDVLRWASTQSARSWGASKRPLRELLPPRVQEVVARPKTGFGIPLGAWLASDGGRFLREKISTLPGDIAAVLDERWLEDALSSLLSGHRRAEQSLWNILALGTWMERAPFSRSG